MDTLVLEGAGEFQEATQPCLAYQPNGRHIFAATTADVASLVVRPDPVARARKGEIVDVPR